MVKHKKVNPEIDTKYQRGIPAISPRAVELKFTPKVNTMPKTKMHIVHIHYTEINEKRSKFADRADITVFFGNLMKIFRRKVCCFN